MVQGLCKYVPVELACECVHAGPINKSVTICSETTVQQ